MAKAATAQEEAMAQARQPDGTVPVSVPGLADIMRELKEWRDLLAATMVPDELKPEGEQTLWPNPWSQDVAMVAHLIHTMRQQLTALTTWQPMETVPTNNEPVLVLLAGDGSRRNAEQRVQHAQYAIGGDGKPFGTIGDHFAFDKPKPLGWMFPPPIPGPKEPDQ